MRFVTRSREIKMIKLDQRLIGFLETTGGRDQYTFLSVLIVSPVMKFLSFQKLA